VYKMTPSGKLTEIYTFPGASKLRYPMALTLGTDGNFYGTALGGGTSAYGGVFKRGAFRSGTIGAGSGR